MATDPTRIVVAQMARVYLAPVGTAAPTDSAAALSAPWKEVGLFTPDSLNFATDPNFEQVDSHQSNYPTRRMQTTDGATLSVDLQEWSAASFAAVFGGGVVTVVTPPQAGPPAVAGEYKWEPPAIGGRATVAALAEVVDGTKRYRFVIPRCMQTEGASVDMQKAKESVLPLRLGVLGSDVGSPWYLLTNADGYASA